MDKIRIGLIGAGNIAQNAHIPAYATLEGVELTAVYDIKTERAQEVAAKYGIAHVCTSLEELVGLQDVDAVSVCTWNNGHAAAAIAAARAGKHVLCEKPMSTTVAEAEAMAAAAKQSGVTFMMGFVNRFRNEAQALRALVEEGALGNVYFARCGWLRRRGTPLGWFTDVSKSGGGPVIDIGVHAIDLAWYIMGKPKPVAISASTHYALGDYKTKNVDRWCALDTDDLVFNVEDSAVGVIRFENNISMNFEVSWAINGKGTQDVFASMYGDKAGFDLYPPQLPTIYGEIGGYLSDSLATTGKTGPRFDAEMAHFVDCIRTGKQPISPAEDGVWMQKMLCGIYDSAKAGREIWL